MSFWTEMAALRDRLFSAAEAPLAEGCAPDANDHGFAAAVIGLSAKMARADGAATTNEFDAFAMAVGLAPEDEAAARRLFQLAQETVHGFESYARQLARRYRARPCVLEDVLDVLMDVAHIDGGLDPAERAYLARVAEIFGLSEPEFARRLAIRGGEADPYEVLGVSVQASDADLRRAWIRLLQENHPDRFGDGAAALARSAHEKTARINAAYAQIQEIRAAAR
jgi:DnaJ like chaperone protein